MDTKEEIPVSVNVNKLTFMEFHAMRNRHRNTSKSHNKKMEKHNVKNVDGDNDYIPIVSRPYAIIGEILEMFEVQMIMIVSILLDIICVVVEIYVQDAQVDVNGKAIGAIMQLIRSFTGFTMYLFLLELAMLIFVFRFSCLMHIGYFTDLVIIIVSLYWELTENSKVLRLLGFFRFWRIIRIVKFMLDDAQQKHETTNKILEEKISIIQELNGEIRILEEMLNQEKKSKSSVEQTLQGYKDEVETLKEALNIAAQSIAEAGMDEYEYIENKEPHSNFGKANIKKDFKELHFSNELEEFKDTIASQPMVISEIRNSFT